MYFGRSSGLVRSSFFPIFYYLLSLSSIGYSLLVFDIKVMFQYLILHSKNMSMLFKSVTDISIHSICPFISSSSSTNHVISLFLVLSWSFLLLPIVYLFCLHDLSYYTYSKPLTKLSCLFIIFIVWFFLYTPVLYLLPWSAIFCKISYFIVL